MDEPNKITLMGVRGRLLLAFLGISMFSLVAAASGLYSLSQVGGALSRITEQRVPEALSLLVSLRQACLSCLNQLWYDVAERHVHRASA